MSMNPFRLCADMLHLAAILTLLYRIWKSKNCIGKYAPIGDFLRRILSATGSQEMKRDSG